MMNVRAYKVSANMGHIITPQVANENNLKMTIKHVVSQDEQPVFLRCGHLHMPGASAAKKLRMWREIFFRCL